MKSYACAWPLAVCLWLAPGLALADAKADAEKQFRAGVSLQKVEDFEAAISAFEASLRLYPTKGAWFNLANCLRATHRYPEALSALQSLERDFGAELQDPLRSTVEMQVAELKNLTATITIEIDQPGAEIAIDGRPIGSSPLSDPVRVGLGDHEVRATLAGFEPAVAHVNLGPAQAATMKLSLRAPGTAPAPAAATPPPTQPPAVAALAPPSQTPPAGEAGGSGLATAGLISAGAGALLLAGGAVTGIWALSIDGDLESSCVDGHCPKHRASDIDRLESLTTATNVLLGVGAAVSVGGLALWLFGDSSESPSATPAANPRDVALTARRGFVGASLTSRF
ncbi:MAG TPA: PEGA domain-containing protein [Polyangiaceae bacterium]